MVERVAHAMSGVIQWDEVLDHKKEHYRTLARIAIAAMREPTEAMVDAGDAAMPAAEGYSLAEDCPRVWQAMINAALAEVAP